MEENTEAQINQLEFGIPLDDEFWFERVRRSIQNSDSKEDIKEMAIFLAKIATQRNAIIKGLVQEIKSPSHIVIHS
jgi:hypothetical protein|tara:strand:+ start:424 stop:651 length:228 start_codon:yes stop_codon:yes gene_type:complete